MSEDDVKMLDYLDEVEVEEVEDALGVRISFVSIRLSNFVEYTGFLPLMQYFDRNSPPIPTSKTLSCPKKYGPMINNNLFE